MTAILHIAAVMVCILFLAYQMKVSLVEILPVFTCGLALLLYALALIRRLSWIDSVGAAAVIIFLFWLVSRGKDERRAFAKACLEKMTEASFITAAFLLIAVAVCTSGKVVTWWDDINFWATDIKSLYYLDGFAAEYANAAPEFGDYPPAAQLIKWWFLHWDPQTFREGLAFAGYYVMNLVFLLPLLRGLRGRNVVVMFLLAVTLWLFPSVAEVYGYEGFCADLTMACIYGAFLYAVVAGDSEKSGIYYYGKLGLYLSVLVLVKSIGFVWALFGLAFLYLYQRGRNETRRRSLLSTLAVAVLPAVTGGSWMFFCLFMRRVTKTTVTAVKYMTTDEYGLSGYAGEFAGAFARAFVTAPLHKEKSIFIDLTPLSLYLCICLTVILLYRNRHGNSLLPKREGRVVLWFSVISGALFYAVIFIAHITIFATETQYLEASGMISSIERYGAPFTVGTLLFLAGIWLERGDALFQKDSLPVFVRRYGAYLCVILFVALTAGYRSGFHGLLGYRQDIETCLSERAAMIGADEAAFLQAITALEKGDSTRVCYIRRGDAPRWVNNSYTGYEASPISVVYRSVNLDDAPADWMVQEIRDSHAAWLYAEETKSDAGAVFNGITDNGEFVCGALYRIEDDGQNMRLTRVSQ